MNAKPHNTYALRLKPGDDVHEEIIAFCRLHDIKAGSIAAIGSIHSPTLAHYTITTKQFTNRVVEGIVEVSSMLGNVSIKDDEPLVHLHVTVSGPDMVAYAGHLVKAKVSATLEIILTAFDAKLVKVHDDKIGLDVWQLAA